jgi:hypothetical protein
MSYSTVLIAADNKIASLPELSILFNLVLAYETSVLSILSFVRLFSNNIDPKANLLTLYGLVVYLE